MAAEKIIVECYGDSLLIKQMGYDYLEGHSGIGQVANRMNKYFNNRFALGVIDNDKTSLPKYFKENIKILGGIGNKVQLIKCEGHAHYVIKIMPAFEGFISGAAKEALYNRIDFGLPASDKQFKELCKDKNLHKNQKMVNFINAVINKNPPSIKAIRDAINFAMNNKPK